MCHGEEESQLLGGKTTSRKLALAKAGRLAGGFFPFEQDKPMIYLQTRIILSVKGCAINNYAGSTVRQRAMNKPLLRSLLWGDRQLSVRAEQL